MAHHLNHTGFDVGTVTMLDVSQSQNVSAQPLLQYAEAVVQYCTSLPAVIGLIDQNKLAGSEVM